MITDLIVENFQSVKQATFKLGRFTVITGPTGAGKSAVIRALRLAAFNRRGTSFIRRGATSCKVAFGPQGWCIGIERGGRGKDSYRIARAGGDGEPDVQMFTKLGGEAPPEVLALHGLSDLNFAGQFDHPYLLDSSGGEAARTLGELTNVSLVLRAAALASQRRQRAATELRQAEQIVARSTEELQRYAALPAQSVSCQRAEEALSRALGAAQRRERLQALISAAEGARQAVVHAEAAAVAVQPPSLEKAEQLQVRRERLAGLTGDAERAHRQAEACLSAGGRAVRDEQAAHQSIHSLLTEAGTCPTCGLPVPRSQ